MCSGQTVSLPRCLETVLRLVRKNNWNADLLLAALSLMESLFLSSRLRDQALAALCWWDQASLSFEKSSQHISNVQKGVRNTTLAPVRYHEARERRHQKRN